MIDAQSVPASALRIAGLTPFTTIDFPGKLSAVAFVQGCPWQCVYCQNAWMQSRAFDPTLAHSSWEELEALLKRRQGLLDAVVFSGGEPCLDPALPAAIEAARALGFEVGLHTGGSYPARLKAVLPMVNWVGLDVKAVPEDETHWMNVVRVPGAHHKWSESLDALLASGIPFECRSTVHPDYFSEEQIVATGKALATRGVTTYVLQICRRPPGQLFSRFGSVLESWPSVETLDTLKGLFEHFKVRRG